MKTIKKLRQKKQKTSITQCYPLTFTNLENIYYLSNKDINNTNNNDTFNFILFIISISNQSFLYFCNNLLLSLTKIISCFYKFRFLLLAFILFSNFVYSSDNTNDDIPTSLIINAYFSSGNEITHIKNDNTDEIKANNDNNNNQNFCFAKSIDVAENICRCQCCADIANKRNYVENDQSDLIYENQNDLFFFFSYQ